MNTKAEQIKKTKEMEASWAEICRTCYTRFLCPVDHDHTVCEEKQEPKCRRFIDTKDLK